jgi:tetratricopeptide (TPR) repeat protein
VSTAANSPTVHQQQRDLAVAWMNRGHALMLQGDDAALAAALEAYNEAILRLRPLVSASESANLSWANSLAAALMNRGHLLHRLHGVTQATLALASFDEANALLGPFVSAIENRESKIENALNPWPRRNLAGTQLNRANLLLDLSRFSEATATAREALTLTVPHQLAESVDADLALKARRALCDAIGRLIVEPGNDQETLAHEATDLVDEAMAVTRHWLERGESGLRPLSLRFFRYGTQLYRLHQPHFLAEFIRENLPSAQMELRDVALEAIDAALSDRPTGYLTLGDASSERRLQTWRELAALRTHLAA